MAALILIVFVLLVAVLAWRRPSTARNCCQSGPWPPDDLSSTDER